MDNSHLDNPWKILNSVNIYDNPWISVKEDAVLNPAGNNGIYGTVHFKNKAIGIIPLDKDNYTWLVGQYRYPLNEYSWEIPMGGGSLNEDLLVSAKRELKEETGLVAHKWTKILRIHTSNSVTDEEGFVYLAEELSQYKPEFEETEKIIIKKILLFDAIAMVMQGKITDSISMAGLLLLARLKNL